jgi:hypothetical protein
MRRLTADDPTPRRIMTQTLGVVHIFVSSKTAEDGLPQHANKSMSAILAVRASASISPAIAVKPSASSSFIVSGCTSRRLTRPGSTRSNRGSPGIERDVIARGVFTSVPDLRRKLMRYIRQYIKSP